MHNNDRVQFAKMMFGLSEIFKGGLSEIGIDLYFNTLSGFDIDEVARGISDVVKTRVYNDMPKPAEIIKTITGGDNVKALSAWDQVLVSARRGCKKHHDPDIEHAVRLCGGWHKLGQTYEEDLHWVKKEFIEAFIDSGHMAFRPAIEPTKLLADISERAECEGGRILV